MRFSRARRTFCTRERQYYALRTCHGAGRRRAADVSDRNQLPGPVAVACGSLFVSATDVRRAWQPVDATTEDAADHEDAARGSLRGASPRSFSRTLVVGAFGAAALATGSGVRGMSGHSSGQFPVIVARHGGVAVPVAYCEGLSPETAALAEIGLGRRRRQRCSDPVRCRDARRRTGRCCRRGHAPCSRRRRNCLRCACCCGQSDGARFGGLHRPAR